MKFRILILYFSIAISGFSQSIDLRLDNAGCRKYKGKLFVYGFESQTEHSKFCIYGLTSTLKIIDSVKFEISSGSKKSYLEIYSDTLHNFLNIYLQEKDNKEVTIVRIGNDIHQYRIIRRVDIARLNNATLFGNDFLYDNTVVFTIKVISDSTGNQFYLNKYVLKSDSLNFDYNFVWQFPFEKKNIQSAQIIYTNKKHVYLFVQRGGEWSGQFVLQIMVETGELIKSVRISDKSAKDVYEYGSCYYNERSKSLAIIGQKLGFEVFVQDAHKLLLKDQKSIQVFFTEIDSTGQLLFNHTISLPIIPTKTLGAFNSGLVLRFRDLKNKSGSYSMWTDVYSLSENGLCIKYVNALQINFRVNAEILEYEKKPIGTLKEIETYFTSLDKLDRNAQNCREIESYPERLISMPIVNPNVLGIKTDSLKNNVWLLAKSEVKKKKIHFDVVRTVKNKIVVENIASSESENKPLVIVIDSVSYILANKIENDKYRLSLFYW